MRYVPWIRAESRMDDTIDSSVRGVTGRGAWQGSNLGCRVGLGTKLAGQPTQPVGEKCEADEGNGVDEEVRDDHRGSALPPHE